MIDRDVKPGPPPDADARSATGDPIFVVGFGRSGTTLLSAMLNGHPDLDCGPETHFFDGLRPKVIRDLLSDPAWPDRAVRYVEALRRTDGSRVLDLFGLSPETFRGNLMASPPSLAALLEQMTVSHARANGANRWVEKSPTHLSALPLIRRLWPRARVVRIVRDPRGVVASYGGVPFGAATPTGDAYIWQLTEDETAGFFRSDRFSITVRYEDLVRSPEPVIRTICDAVDEPFDAAMLRPWEGSESVVLGYETWKGRVSGAIDPSRAEAWRTELPIVEQERVALICSRGMAAHGYPGVRQPRVTIPVYGFSRSFIVETEPALTAAAGDGVVVTSPEAAHSGGTAVPITIVWGRSWVKAANPGKRGGRAIVRAITALRALAAVAARRRAVVWVRPIASRHRSLRRGRVDRVADAIAQHVVPITTAEGLAAVIRRSVLDRPGVPDR